jgi:hypothetical protein
MYQRTHTMYSNVLFSLCINYALHIKRIDSYQDRPMLLTIILITAIVCLLALYLWTINNRYDYFKRRGIPVPPYRFFFGHYKELWSTQSF